MNASTQIIPLRNGSEINEEAEFQLLSYRVDDRRFESKKRAYALAEDRDKKLRAAEARERRVERNFKLMGMGAAASCCSIATVYTLLELHRVLALFPIALLVLILLMGACEK